jgi:hypothetical protein
METEKEIEYKSTIMEMRNIIKNQERVIEELMLKVLDIKIENEEVDASILALCGLTRLAATRSLPETKQHV